MVGPIYPSFHSTPLPLSPPMSVWSQLLVISSKICWKFLIPFLFLIRWVLLVMCNCLLQLFAHVKFTCSHFKFKFSVFSYHFLIDKSRQSTTALYISTVMCCIVLCSCAFIVGLYCGWRRKRYKIKNDANEAEAKIETVEDAKMIQNMSYERVHV